MESFVFKIVETEEELQIAKRIRHEVFVIEQEIPQDADEDGFDKSSIHLIVKKEKQIIGTGRLTPTGEGKGLISRIAVLEKARRQGLGKKIIRKLEDLARQNSIDYLYLDPHDYLEFFYQKLGYTLEKGWSKTVAKHRLIRMFKFLK